VLTAIVAHRRNAHAVACENNPDGAEVRSAIQVLIGLQNAIASIEKPAAPSMSIFSVMTTSARAMPVVNANAAAADSQYFACLVDRRMSPTLRFPALSSDAMLAPL